MTYVEAIKHTEMFLNIYDLFNDDETAIKTLIEATEKQIPKKPVWQNEDAGYYYDTGEGWSCICPTCGKYIDEDEHHCKCGQAINWSGVK